MTGIRRFFRSEKQGDAPALPSRLTEIMRPQKAASMWAAREEYEDGRADLKCGEEVIQRATGRAQSGERYREEDMAGKQARIRQAEHDLGRDLTNTEMMGLWDSPDGIEREAWGGRGPSAAYAGRVAEVLEPDAEKSEAEMWKEAGRDDERRAAAGEPRSELAPGDEGRFVPAEYDLGITDAPEEEGPEPGTYEWYAEHYNQDPDWDQDPAVDPRNSMKFYNDGRVIAWDGAVLQEATPESEAVEVAPHEVPWDPQNPRGFEPAERDRAEYQSAARQTGAYKAQPEWADVADQLDDIKGFTGRVYGSEPEAGSL